MAAGSVGRAGDEIGRGAKAGLIERADAADGAEVRNGGCGACRGAYGDAMCKCGSASVRRFQQCGGGGGGGKSFGNCGMKLCSTTVRLRAALR